MPFYEGNVVDMLGAVRGGGRVNPPKNMSVERLAEILRDIRG